MLFLPANTNFQLGFSHIYKQSILLFRLEITLKRSEKIQHHLTFFNLDIDQTPFHSVEHK